MNRQARYLTIEETQVARLVEATALSRLDEASRQDLCEILLQRRHLAMEFSGFCDSIMCALEDSNARELVAEIVKAEYAESNHRNDFVIEISNTFGLTRRQIVTHPLSGETRRAVQAVNDLAAAVAHYDDLPKLVVLRFFGEVTPGLEFGKLFDELKRREILTEETSCFLWPHVQYDVLGDLKNVSHAERYVQFISPLLNSDADWGAVTHWIARCSGIRRGFYRQFDLYNRARTESRVDTKPY